jgi:DNA-binding NarL/FixJ family response regulator
MMKKTVFIVDDSPGIINQLVKLINSSLLNVTGTADTVLSAKKWLAENRADYVILDIGLPDGSGLDILAWLNENKTSGLKIVFTNYYSESIHTKSMALGAHHVLDKTADIDLLISILES